ncbi:MAG: flagellar biosynthesis protein FlgD [Vitreoscilla sp.]|nr:flagellar hook assembly protein FlgD [Burkholderiales bacterium]MBP6337345.1 flagellar biosynthesis protein FlgD [Vitreoscilla sp.]MBP6675568.1 flagellar biosynthesis protein FlgD [Vitreoscilla sp.]
MSTSAVGNSTATNTATASSSLTATNASEQADRFLKLLVAQMKNQDPLNPLDNAQVTSQMAQISTVSGLDKVNTSVNSLGTQFTSLQAMQAAALVGHDVVVEGNKLRMNGAAADGGFELGSKADKVAIQITNAAGTVIDTVNLTNVDAGRQSFNWNVPTAYQGEALSFKLTATVGGAAVNTMALQTQKINAVSSFNNTLALELDDGSRVAYDAVWAFL